GEEIVGVHSRRQSSVLFSLDELGREGGQERSGSEQFVTDSSGLIDIQAIATNESAAPKEDPFGASGAGLVLPARGAPAAMTVPVVERKRGLGPWILAAAALLLVGGIAIALIMSGGDDPKTGEPTGGVAAAGTAEGAPATDAEPAAKANAAKEAAAKEAAAKEAAAKEAADKEAAAKEAAAKEAADKEAAAKAEGDTPTEGDKVAGEQPAEGDKPDGGEAIAAAGDKNAAATGDKPATKPKPKPKARTETKPKPRTEPKPRAETKPAARVETKPSSSGTTAGNTAKVNDLLNKLNSGDSDSGKPKSEPESDASLPNKLSAASVRNTIRGRFGKCGSMIEGGGGSVTVQTQFVISSSGVVQSARVSDGGGTSAAVQRCVVGVIKATRFGKFKQSTMQVNLPVRLL
ncbi:MAG: hypothetical protein KDI55_27485, partial [Anaerolineae bacterium]|nr:hypothetical protein [Anaerolineae bacterium]